MTEYKFSSKLKEYLNKVETESGRKIKFFESTDLGIKGITAAYLYHPQYIRIIINPENPRPLEDIERSIAHEATHGYIIYNLGFCRSDFHNNATDDYKRDVQLIFTMIEDIVVNKIIQNNGFPPFGHEYLPMVHEETEVARRGEEAGEIFYQSFADDPRLEALLMISRYLIAWGFLKFYSLKQQDVKIIKEFTITFQKFYPDYYRIVSKIEDILEQNNIFTGDGECKAIGKILELFNLDGGVKLVRD